MNKDDITLHLSQLFTPTHINVIDNSSQHHGHQGTPHTENTHFDITIVSDQFNEKSLIERHRMVNNALKSAFSEQLHALKITAKTPHEWQ